ncbi:MAG: ANTAR domain-containing response regulator [Streptosporangiaceae bacterium]
MSGSELTSGTADLLSLANASEPRSLNQLVTLATRQVRACSGATAALWRDREPVIMAASHPDLPELVEAQLGSGRGPVLDALTGGEPVNVPDMLTETRWPEYTTAALRRSVRCSITLSYLQGARDAAPDRDAVTLSLFAARPRVLEASQLDMAELLITYGGAVMGNAADFGDAQRTAQQLRDAAESRPVVDQARGMLMQTLSCTSDEAMRWLRRTSQQRNIRVADVASMIVAGEGLDSLKPRRPRRA